ncbi:MAG: hypothetical protein ACRDU4_03845 [Mycobacterium sp.]
MSRKSEVRDVAALTPELTPAANHAAVCAVLKWAVRTSGVSRVEIQDLCEELGLDQEEARIYGQRQRQATRMAIRDDAVRLADHALQECLSEYCHPNEFGGYDTDSRKVAEIAVDTLLANRDLLSELAGLAQRESSR